MPTSYEKRSKEELLELAAERDIEGRSALNKDELIAALRDDPSPDHPDTPSGLAAAKVGEAPELRHDNVEEVLAHGEAYQAEKRKHRWG